MARRATSDGDHPLLGRLELVQHVAVTVLDLGHEVRWVVATVVGDGGVRGGHLQGAHRGAAQGQRGDVTGIVVQGGDPEAARDVDDLVAADRCLEPGERAVVRRWRWRAPDRASRPCSPSARSARRRRQVPVVVQGLGRRRRRDRRPQPVALLERGEQGEGLERRAGAAAHGRGRPARRCPCPRSWSPPPRRAPRRSTARPTRRPRRPRGSRALTGFSAAASCRQELGPRVHRRGDGEPAVEDQVAAQLLGRGQPLRIEQLVTDLALEVGQLLGRRRRRHGLRARRQRAG